MTNATQKRRRTAELLGFNGESTAAGAYRRKDGWFCFACSYPEDCSIQPTMKAAEAELRDMGAMRIVRCPELSTEAGK